MKNVVLMIIYNLTFVVLAPLVFVFAQEASNVLHGALFVVWVLNFRLLVLNIQMLYDVEKIIGKEPMGEDEPYNSIRKTPQMLYNPLGLALDLRKWNIKKLREPFAVELMLDRL